jgi:hypothetical protein
VKDMSEIVHVDKSLVHTQYTLSDLTWDPVVVAPQTVTATGLTVAGATYTKAEIDALIVTVNALRAAMVAHKMVTS